ncbi:hypothetical protein [Mycolicibacterium baixiangningiae]|uniref:hypothetical protein n=1 Tax=Mycolicibacterium baixiangningiae TaxID=2761578 RepID=UPI001865F74A|nr:hypothetical protein [Mycolicibacterium baixiangningiae]
MGVVGTWEVRIKTPIGSLDVTYEFADDGGSLRGSASSKSETVPLQDIVAAEAPGEHRVTWRQSVTKPMRLHLDFDVVIDGDRMSGHSRAGRLPRSAVTGVRRG